MRAPRADPTDVAWPGAVRAAVARLANAGFRCEPAGQEPDAPAGFVWLVDHPGATPGQPLSVLALSLGEEPSAPSLEALSTAAMNACESGGRREGAGRLGLLLLWGTQETMRERAARWRAWMAALGTRVSRCIAHQPDGGGGVPSVMRQAGRGQLCGELIVFGVQGHVAYPHLADNPIHRGMPVLAALCAEAWDTGDTLSSGIGFQVSGIRVDTNAHNVIPGVMTVDFSFLHSVAVSKECLASRMVSMLERSAVTYKLRWHEAIAPFSCMPGALTDLVSTASLEATGVLIGASAASHPSCWNALSEACDQFVGLEHACGTREMPTGDAAGGGALVGFYRNLMQGMAALAIA